MLVAAFAGRDRAGDAGREIILRVYQEAIEGGYRFYSFGDCIRSSGPLQTLAPIRHILTDSLAGI